MKYEANCLKLAGENWNSIFWVPWVFLRMVISSVLEVVRNSRALINGHRAKVSSKSSIGGHGYQILASGTGEVAQPQGACGFWREPCFWFPASIERGSQPSVTSFSGDSTSSLGLCEYYTHMHKSIHRHICIHIVTNKKSFKKENKMLASNK